MPSKPKHRKHWLFFWLIFLLAGSYVAYALTAPLALLQPQIIFSFSRAATPVQLVWPGYGEAAVGAAGYGVLATHGGDNPVPTASTIKIMTALAVLKLKPIGIHDSGPSVTITQADVDAYNKYIAEDGSVVGVVLGEQLTERQALEALLLPSANNMAETLARWAFGSLDAYTTYATSYARQLGMTNTTITDPSGFLPTTTSTPHDLVILGEAALADSVIAQIVSESTTTIPVQGLVHNVNTVLGKEGIIGLKTGNNDQDKGCFLFAAQRTVGGQNISVVGAIMNGPALPNTLADALPLIRSMDNGFTAITVVRHSTPLAAYDIPWGNQLTATVNTDVKLMIWDNSTTRVSVNTEQLQAPVKAGNWIGTLILTNSANDTVTTVPIVAQQPLPRPSPLWRVTHFH